MFKKSLHAVALVIFICGAAFGQRNCGTTEYMQQQFAQDPGYQTRLDEIETFTQNYIANNPDAGSRAVVTIPVVVHIVYNVAAENIADAQVYNQMDVLNADFRRLNADAGETPAAFLGSAADSEIEFCLATTDPSGNPTTGITRTSTTKTSFGTDNQMKGSTYGHTPWDATKYLNIWVCDLSGGLLGYAQFPGGSTSTDGVAIDYVYFGIAGAGSSPYDEGRTATHEVGHWLNLYHIWGDDGTSCAGSDLVADTPNQADETYGCPGATIRISCSNGPNGDMYQNYMDYTDDGCMNIFTSGQKTRMQALFSAGGSRVGITTSTGCSGGGGGTCNTPTGLSTTSIGTTTATFNWGAATGATGYNVRYKLTSSGTWTNTTSATTSKAVTGLTAGSAYEWQVQTDCGGGSTSAYSASSTFSTTGGGGTCTDVYEANETSAAAKTLTTGSIKQGLIGSSTDKDWFKFTTTSPNTKIKINLTSLPADYDVKLYNQSVVQKGVSENGGTADEQIIWNSTAAGTRYIQVYGYAGVFNTSDCYDLLISVSSTSFRTDGSDIALEEVYDNEIVGVYPNPAEDIATLNYFSIQEDLTVQVNIVDMMGKVVSATDHYVSGGENMIKMDFSNLAEGVYFIQVSNGKSTYNSSFVKQ